MSDADQLRRLLLERSVRRGDFVLASGQRSSYYIDCRLTTMSAEGQVLIGRTRDWRRSRRQGGARARSAGSPWARTPWRTRSRLPAGERDLVIDAFSVRKEAKDHGTAQLIEGNFKPGDEVVVVEDVITSGGSAQRAIAAVEGAGGRVVGVLAVVDREQGGGKVLAKDGRSVVVLTTTAELGLKAGDYSG